MATGDRRAPHGKTRTKVKAVPPKRKGVGKRVSSKDIHKDAWTGLNQDPSTYLSTVQLAEDLGKWATTYNGVKMVYPETVYRWCKQWFGSLPPGRTGPGMGYRIPLIYRYIARIWYQTENPMIREAARVAILEDGEKSKPYIVTVANLGSTHYTDHEVANRVWSLLDYARQHNRMIHVLYVGDERNN